MSFTRQEVITMTGIKAGKLSYLDSTGLVVPEKRGNPKRPIVIYSVEQVIQLKIIQRLREKLSLQTIKVVIEQIKSIDDLLHELRADGNSKQILDFQKRIKGTLIELTIEDNKLCQN
jgi:DNA-binding transcriptional MerR regulator